MTKAIGVLIVGCFLMPLLAADKIKDFRGTDQRLALIGFKTETVEPEVEKRFLSEFRKAINHYSRSYGDASIAGFQMAENSKGQYFKPAREGLSDDQRKWLITTAKSNSVDIIVLGELIQRGLDVDVALQLFDARIETLSKVESIKMSIVGEPGLTEELVHRTLNYMDKDGFVHESSQDFLERLNAAQLVQSSSKEKSEFAVNPLELAGGRLAGEISVGGEKKPFWETWWFWSLVGGGALTAGGLSYYFLVVNQPPTKANVQFALP